MDNIKFLAECLGDFYYLSYTNLDEVLENEIEISQKEYETMLRNNQEKGWMVRAYRREDGSLYVKSVEEHQPSQFHIWDIETGSWLEDLELKKRILLEEYINKMTSELEWATEEVDHLQEMVDFEEADEEDQEHLLLAKKYRVALNKIKRSSDYPNIEVKLPERPY